MIFVTVGAQMPFDRLIRTVDEWAGKNPAVYIYAQIGETDYVPKHIRWDKSVSPDQLRTLVQSADVVVALDADLLQKQYPDIYPGMLKERAGYTKLECKPVKSVNA